MLNFNNTLEDRLESPEKECQLLSELINSKHSLLDYGHEVKTDLFGDEFNQALHRCILEMQELGKDVNKSSMKTYINTLVNRNLKTGLLDQLDIVKSYTLQDTISNVIKDLDTIKKNRIVFEEIISGAKSKFINNEPIDDIIRGITDSLLSMDADSSDNTSYEEHVDKTLNAIENPEQNKDYLRTRLKEFNDQFGGVIKDRYYLVGGESGAGKTALVVELIGQLCEDYPDDVAVLFYSYEMSQSRVITRAISRKTKFTESKLSQRSKKLSADEIKKIKVAVDEIKRYPLEIVYQTLSDRELKLRTRRFALKNRGKHLLIFLDHIGLVDGNENDMRVKTIRTSKIMKSFATDYKASVFVLTQLKKELTDENNPVNKKNYHKPNDSHIMESGALKADSDAVILLWRPEMRRAQISYNNHEMFDARGKLWLLNFKNRDGQAPTDLIFGCEIKYNHLYNLEDPFSPAAAPLILEDMKAYQEIDDFSLEPNTTAVQDEPPF
jgi:replicative DNA helicase